jgi:hypothetical protein
VSLLKNSPAPGSDPLFSANGTIFEASEPDLTPLWTFNRLFQQALVFSETQSAKGHANKATLFEHYL